MATAKFLVEGMHCTHCCALLKNSLSLVKGVTHTDVQVGAVTAEYDEDVADLQKIKEAVTRFGYRIKA